MKKQSQVLVSRLKEKKLTLALAESMTCGLAAHRLSSCVGISEILKGCIVCYSPGMKRDVLQISDKMIRQYTCESKEVTEALVRNLSRLVKADIYAAITGLASPGGSETKAKPEGTVFLSVKTGKKVYNQHYLFRGAPLKIKKKSM